MYIRLNLIGLERFNSFQKRLTNKQVRFKKSSKQYQFNKFNKIFEILQCVSPKITHNLRQSEDVQNKFLSINC